MPISREEVAHIAELARLAIPAEREDRVAAQLSEVLDYMAVLSRLDLAGCEPTAFAPTAAALREDELDSRRLTPAAALAAGPAAEGGFFLVPPVVENLEP